MILKIPKGSILRDAITIGDYKFFYVGGHVQCATCLNVMGWGPDHDVPKQDGKIRELILTKDCNCPPQE